MFTTVLHALENHNIKARIIPVERLHDLKRDLDDFAGTQELNGFQRYILSDMYQFALPDAGFPIRSVIVAAMPVPAYADVMFEHGGRKFYLKSLARYYPGQVMAHQALKELLEPMGHHIEPAGTLPLKRLAVCSGLALYGRNNITYVEGMGSYQTISAFFTDLPYEEDGWRGVAMMDRCAGCSACLQNCPTGAIRQDRFLIDNERCLSCINEFPGEFPEWLPKNAHHCLYDCMMCQNICPVNKPYWGNGIGPIAFDETETADLLAGKPMEEFLPETQGKFRLLGMDQWLAAIPRNLSILLDQQR